MEQFYNINNSSPRFIEVYGTYENPLKEGWKAENELYPLFINWNEVISVFESVDGWTVLRLIERAPLIEYALDNEGEDDPDGPISTLWVKEDFSHFVRRVNKGLAITMIKDGDE